MRFLAQASGNKSEDSKNDKKNQFKMEALILFAFGYTFISLS